MSDKYEYKIVIPQFPATLTIDELVDELNKLGQDRWMLVSYIPLAPATPQSSITIHMIFMRSISRIIQ